MSLSAFDEKLKDKKQSESLRRQAQHAISLYHQLLTPHDIEKPITTCEPQKNLSTPTKPKAPTTTIPAEQQPKPTNNSWIWVYDKLSAMIKVRHYSPKTLVAYRGWVHKLQTFTKSKDPNLIAMEDVKNFLTHQAVVKDVSASTQNQAFNALLFLFRHVLEKEFSKVEGVVRAKQRPYIPTVLSRDEINRIFDQLKPPYDLVANLLYGGGLRLSECLKLRVQDLNFDTLKITVHDGKGKKDRTVPLAKVTISRLQAQIQSVTNLHQDDLKADYDGVFLPNRLAEKYKTAAKSFPWQWLFPAKALTLVPETQRYQRYHLHPSHVQKAIKRAVNKAAIPKRASAHTLRHSFASHLLQAHYDIRTIQELMGHSNIQTTMIYTHTLQRMTSTSVESPLDF